MQRLLKDAQKVSGVKYDLSSYADIVEAIHVVQTEMGITGTTAKEAATTIQGSAASAKAAWENLKTGFADENADLGQLILSFVKSVSTAAKNLIPRIEQTMAGIGKALSVAAQTLLQDAVGSIVSGLPQLAASIGTLVSGLSQVLINSAPVLLAAVLALMDQAREYIGEHLPEFVATGLSALLSFSEGFRGGVGQLVDAALELVQTLADGVVEALPEFIATVPTIISNFANAINDNAPKIIKAGLEIIVTLVKGLIDNIPVIIQNMPKIIAAVWDTLTAVNWVSLGAGLIKSIGNGIKSMVSFAKTSIGTVKTAIHNEIKALPQTFMEIGKNMIKGLINGVKSMVSSLTKNVGSAITSVVSSVRDMLGIHSPSKVFASIGEYMMDGLSVGLLNSSGKVMKTISDVISEVKTRFSALSDIFSSRQDIADLQYQLWELTGGRTASTMEKYSRKLEALSKQEKDQAAIVEAAEAAYKAVVAQYGENSKESYEYQRTLLKEQLAHQELLETMKQYDSKPKVFRSIGEYMMDNLSVGLLNSSGKVMDTISDIVSEVRSRFSYISDVFSARQDISDLQYQLWEMTGGKDASALEKYSQKMASLSKQEKDQAAIVEAAQAAYESVVAQYGENSKESYEYQKTLLQEQIAYQKLIETMKEYREESIRFFKASGMKEGLIAATGDAVAAATSCADEMVNAVKDELGIHSPSTVFAGIGENMALGLGKGFAAEMQGVSASIQDAIPTPAVDAVYNAAAGMVNGLAAANAGNGGGSYTINLVLQNGQQIASWLLPDLRDAARSDPEVAMA